MKELIRQAVDANIAVYDNDADCGYLTPRLIKLLKSVYKKQFGEQLKYIYLDSRIKLDNDCAWLEPQVNIPCKSISYLHDYIQNDLTKVLDSKKYFILSVGKNHSLLGMC